MLSGGTGYEEARHTENYTQRVRQFPYMQHYSSINSIHLSQGKLGCKWQLSYASGHFELSGRKVDVVNYMVCLLPSYLN